MANNTAQYRIDIETKRAQAEIRSLRKEVDKLGGQSLLKLRREAKKARRDLKALGGGAQKAKPFILQLGKTILGANLATIAASKAIGLVVDGLKALGKAILVAAQVEELGGVLNFVGQRAGYSLVQLAGFKKELLESGIAQKETNQSMLRAIQGHVDLADAVQAAKRVMITTVINVFIFMIVV